MVACISFIFGLATYGSFATRHPQRVAAVASMAMAIGIVLAIERDFTRPIADTLHDRTHDGIVLQSSSSSCAAASAANFVRQYGITRTEPEMAALLGTTRFGSSPAQVAHGLSQLGFSCRKTVLPSSDPRPLHAPAVLFFPPSATVDVGHAVLYTGHDGTYTSLLDPLIGRRLLTSEELAARWRGHAVECVAANVAIPATAVPTVIEAPTGPKTAAPARPDLCPDGRPRVVPAPCPGKDLAEALHCPGRDCREGTVWNGKACVPPCGERDGG
ncbi:MAG: cysteine peptidase family C39 domain-containing protein [Minicystis sp.]